MTLQEDKPPNKRQAGSIHVYTFHRKSPLNEDSLSTKDKTAGPKSVLINLKVLGSKIMYILHFLIQTADQDALVDGNFAPTQYIQYREELLDD